VPGSPAYALIITDLAEQIGAASEPSVVLSKRALEGRLFKGGIPGHLAHIFGLGVIFEVGIQLHR